MRFQKGAFSKSSKMHRSIPVHTTVFVLMHFPLAAREKNSTEGDFYRVLENDRIARCDVS